MIGHNAGGFDNYIVLNSLRRSYKSMKNLKASRGLIKLSFKASSVIENDEEVPKYNKFVYSMCHIPASLKEIQKEYKIQSNLMKGETDHDVITICKYKDHENSRKPYFIDYALGLAYVAAELGNHIQKLTSIS